MVDDHSTTRDLLEFASAAESGLLNCNADKMSATKLLTLPAPGKKK